MHERMDGLRVMSFLQFFSYIRTMECSNERLCAMEPSYWLERFPPLADFEPGTARAAGQGFTYWATGLQKVYEAYIHTGSNLKILIAHHFYDILFFSPNFPLFMPI